MTNPPHFKGFRPIGLAEESKPIVLNYEEYEAIRLSDFELYGQVEAARIMEVSRPTYARVYESARRKVAQAFVLGRPIVFEGGKVYFDSEWYACNSCGCWFNKLDKEQEVVNCALCGSSNVDQCIDDVQTTSNKIICYCPVCDIETAYGFEDSCKKKMCSTCNGLMYQRSAPFQYQNRKN